jgi:hypothetical protein
LTVWADFSLPKERGRSTTFELSALWDLRIKSLTVIHEIDKPGSKFLEAVSGSWPHILASLKSLLETGESPVETREWPEGGCKRPQATEPRPQEAETVLNPE